MAMDSRQRYVRSQRMCAQQWSVVKRSDEFHRDMLTSRGYLEPALRASAGSYAFCYCTGSTRHYLSTIVVVHRRSRFGRALLK